MPSSGERQYCDIVHWLSAASEAIGHLDQRRDQLSSSGFTDEELNFIINYDIKYRMGQDLEDLEDE